MPPKLDSHDELELWMCKAHNDVNLRLDKPEFDCRRTSLRWGNADCDEVGTCAIRVTGSPQTRIRAIWVPKHLVTNLKGPNKVWVPKNAC